MARTRLDLCYLFSLCVQSWLYASSQHAAVSGEAGIKNKTNISPGVHLNTSSDVTIRVREQLKLNCTFTGAVNSSSVQLSWYHGGQDLSNFTRKLNNKTIQLVIDHVSWINNGSYTCRGNSGERVQPKSVMVRVGDIPGPPRDVWINNVEMRTYIHWKAPVDQGGLQFSYAVKGQCKNASTELPECQKDSITLCEHILQEHGSVPNQFVCTVSTNLHWFAPGASRPVSYIAFIEASNVLGSRRSDAVEFTFDLFNVLLTTPQPDISPFVKEVEPPGTVKLTWKDAREQRRIEVEYTILYYKDGDKENKSVIAKAPRTNVLISDLVGFSRYHFFILVRYAEQGTAIYGIYSKGTELTVRTKISAPKVPPVITNCSHWSNLGLMVTWKIPQAEYFNGPSKSATIFYRCQTGQNISGNFTVRNSTTRSAVITTVRPSDACLVWIVWMKLCNTPELCSSISNMCQAKGSLQGNPSQGPKDTRNSFPGPVLIGLAGAAGGLVLVIITVCCYRHRKNKAGNARRPLRNVLALPQVIHGYDEIEESLDNCYDVINV